MLSRLRTQNGIKKLTQSLSLPIFTIPVLRTTSDAYDSTSTASDSPEKPMKKPIITGRNSKQVEEELDDPYPNPFIGKDLPYGRRVLFDNVLEEDLAQGTHWHPWNDRFMQHFDIDFVERAYGNADLYRSPLAKRSCEDITMNHDIDYHYRVHNIGMHLEMMRQIPHLKPLVPELTQDFENVTAKWQDIVEEILGDRDSENIFEKEEETTITSKTEEISTPTEYKYKSTKIETKRLKMKKRAIKYGSYKIKNNIIEDRPLVGDELIAFRNAKLKEEINPSDPEKERKQFARKQIELSTIKTFVDDKVEEKDFVRLIFVDAMGTKYYVYGMVGETLLQCCRRYLIPIDGYCNGYDRGIIRIYGAGPVCHLCQMDISPKYFHLIPPFDWRERLAFVKFRHITPTSRLGCCIWIRPEFDGMLVNIPVSLACPYGRTMD